MISESEYVAIIRREIYEAQGYDADVLADKRAMALDYYYGLHDTAGEGRSNIVSHDVADVVNSLMAQIMPMFATSMLQFIPDSEEDEEQAQLESDYVQKTIEQNMAHSVLYSAAFDALLQGNGWIKVELVDDVDVAEEKYEGELDELTLAMVSQPQAENQEVDVKKTAKGYTVKRSTTTQRLKVRTIAPDVMLFSSAWDQFKLQELRFVGERIVYSESDLLGMGIPQKIISSLPDTPSADYWPAIRSREGIYQDDIAHDSNSNQDATKLKECFDCYIQVDIEENGTTELRHALISGSEMLVEDAADHIPYATGSPVIIPHRIQGMGMFELMQQIQDSKTQILRKYIDSLEVAVLGRYEAVEGMVNMDDALSARPNGVVRTRAAGSFTPLNTAQVSGEAITGLNYLDTVREQRGGASLDMNDADRQLMASSAMAATGIMDSHEAMAGWYCSNLVHTLLKTTFMLVHRTLRLGMQGQQGAKLRGKWVQTNPQEWPSRNHIEVTAGMTSKERTQKITGLTTVLQQQLSWIEQGFEGIITDRGKVYSAASDWIRAAQIGEPDEYLVDPDSEEAQEQAQRMTEQEQQQAQEMKQLQEAMMQMQASLEGQKLELDKYKHDSELKYKYYDTNVDAGVKKADRAADSEIEEAKLTTDAMLKLVAAGGESDSDD